MNNFKKYFERYRSTVGILSLLVIFYFAEPDARSIVTGFFIMMLGAFFRAWSSGYINKNNELATKGPYSLSRNPLYFGNFVLGLGIAVAADHIYCYIIFFVYYFLFFPALMVMENKRMKRLFGTAYDRWAHGLNSFFPAFRKMDFSGFNISYYMKNKEYRVLYFTLFIVIALVFKALFFFKNY